MQHYIDMWTNYFNFSGTTSRQGYWMAFLFDWIIRFVVCLIAGFTGLTFLGTVYTAVAFIPGISIAVRRLRDAGKHWGWCFINFIPLVGQIIFIIMLCKPSVAKPAYNAAPVYDGYDY